MKVESVMFLEVLCKKDMHHIAGMHFINGKKYLAVFGKDNVTMRFPDGVEIQFNREQWDEFFETQNFIDEIKSRRIGY